MGFWGVDLYQNDTSLDVKEQFEEQLRKGRDVEEVTLELIQEYEGIENDRSEECAFWLALADTQWTWGVLLPYVKNQAMLLLEKGGDLECWQNEPSTIQLQRKRVLLDLQYNLLQPQPPKKKPVKRRVYRCEWKIGDVFAYRLEGKLAREKGLYGRYLLIQKVDEGTWYPGHIVPIVYIKITGDNKLPTTLEEYNQLEYVQTSFTKYEDRFLPLDGRRLQEDIEEKSKLNYVVDEFGFLPEYRILLLNTSKKVIPSKLIYIDNYMGAVPPQKEFIPHTKINICHVFWGKGEEFEENILERYCNHNLRGSSIYLKKNTDVQEEPIMNIILQALGKN